MNTRETARQDRKVPGIRVLELEAFRWFGADRLGRRRHQPPTRSLPRAARSSCGRSGKTRRSIKLRLRAAALRRDYWQQQRRAACADPQAPAPAPAAGSATAPRPRAMRGPGTREKFVRSLICGSTTAYLASGLSAGRPVNGDRAPRRAGRLPPRNPGSRASRTRRAASASSSGVGA